MLYGRPRSPTHSGHGGGAGVTEHRRSSGNDRGGLGLHVGGGQPPARRANTTVEEIKRIDLNREQRRRAADEIRRTRQEEAAILGAQCGGACPDIDFHRMIRDFRQQCPDSQAFDPVDFDDPSGIAVCVRKRPLQQHESVVRELDCITTCNPLAIVHERKLKVDGITKCLESHQFQFDRVFGEDTSTDDVYRSVAQPLVPWVIGNGGRATLFAYGQTGSGKTHTMTGLQRLLAQEIFDDVASRSEPFEIAISFFEIYGGRPYDLLNNRQRLETLEDSRNEVQISGLTERAVTNAEGMLQCIELGNSQRTTHATAINRDSSRSHAICSVCVRLPGTGSAHAKITLVDLAGSERAADSKSTIRQRRVEGAQINKSLLALKECIRAMGNQRDAHIPFRASKLTLVLRDAFASKCPSRTVMIACISPGISSADHSVNTLRYSDRLKDHPRAARHSMSFEDSFVDSAERPRRPALGNERGGRSPDTRSFLRRRSPSPSDVGAPSPGVQPVQSYQRPSLGSGGLGSGGLPVSSGVAARGGGGGGGGDVQALQSLGDAGLTDSEEEEEPSMLVEDELISSQPKIVAPTASGRGAAAPVVARSAVPSRGRQQPLLRNTAGGPLRADALGSRSGYGGAAVQVHHSRASVIATAPVATAPAVAAAAAPAPQVQDAVAVAAAPAAEVAVVRVVAPAAAPGAPLAGAARAPQADGSGTEPAAAAAADGRDADLRQEDDRYLHATLTTEVYERSAAPESGAGVVDVGVQDLEDLAHLEALDAVRQWEDKIVQQHMVALQEDAKLLTAESELLSQVQQGASEDIDWYVGELEACVRRKLGVYSGLLSDLEAFKQQLRREEFLSRSCQRNRGGRSFIDGAGGAEADRSAAQAAPADSSQRAPHTPR